MVTFVGVLESGLSGLLAFVRLDSSEIVVGPEFAAIISVEVMAGFVVEPLDDVVVLAPWASDSEIVS